MRFIALTSGIVVLALAGCTDAPPPASAPLPPPPVVASSGTPAPLAPAPTGQVGQTPQMAPPLATQVTDVVNSQTRQVPGQPNCNDYRVTGTLDGAVRTVTGRSCRQPDGTLQVTEHNPVTGQTTTTTYPAPPTGAGAPAGYGTTSTATAVYPAYATYGFYGPAYPFAFYDSFFFGYPFFGFGCCGYHGFYHGGFYHGGFHGGFHRH